MRLPIAEPAIKLITSSQRHRDKMRSVTNTCIDRRSTAPPSFFPILTSFSGKVRIAAINARPSEFSHQILIFSVLHQSLSSGYSYFLERTAVSHFFGCFTSALPATQNLEWAHFFRDFAVPAFAWVRPG